MGLFPVPPHGHALTCLQVMQKILSGLPMIGNVLVPWHFGHLVCGMDRAHPSHEFAVTPGSGVLLIDQLRLP